MCASWLIDCRMTCDPTELELPDAVVSTLRPLAHLRLRTTTRTAAFTGSGALLSALACIDVWVRHGFSVRQRLNIRQTGYIDTAIR